MVGAGRSDLDLPIPIGGRSLNIAGQLSGMIISQEQYKSILGRKMPTRNDLRPLPHGDMDVCLGEESVDIVICW